MKLCTVEIILVISLRYSTADKLCTGKLLLTL